MKNEKKNEKKSVKRDGKSSMVSVGVSLMVPSMTLQQMPNNCKMPKCAPNITKIKNDIGIVSLICCGSLAHSVCHISQ